MWIKKHGINLTVILNPAYNAIVQCVEQITITPVAGMVHPSPMSYKRDLYRLKCYLDDVYKDLPKFAGEEIWEKERLIQVLKK